MKRYIQFYIFGGCFGLLVLFLCWEYYSLHIQIARVCALQEQYYRYIDSVRRMLRKQPYQDGTVCSSEDEDHSFLVIDRSPEYLKETALSYLKDQKLDSLLNRINLREWDEYTEQLLHDNSQRHLLESAQSRKNVSNVKKPVWLSSCKHRASLTGITFCSPLERSRFWLSSFFGSRKKPNGQIGFHQGIDMAAQRGTEVKAVAPGTIEYAGYSPGYGNNIIIVHDAIYKSRYAHLDAIYVCAGQKVESGKKIGAVGDTGFTIKKGKDASHLHFELYERGRQVNPLALLSL